MVTTPTTEDAVTLLLNGVADDNERARRLVPVLYDKLRGAANLALSGERADHTLNPTALVHEAYVRLSGERKIPWQNRGHFYAAAAEAMRRILIDHARARGRSEARRPVNRPWFSDLAELSRQSFDDVMRFDEAFGRLQSEWPEAADVLRLRLFAGLSVRDTAEYLGLSASTVDRRWAFVRAWLYRELGDGPGADRRRSDGRRPGAL